MQRTAKVVVMILMAFAVVLAGGFAYKAEAKSPELVDVEAKLMNLRHLTSGLCFDIAELRVDYAGGKVTTTTVRSDILSKKTTLEGLLDELKPLMETLNAKARAAIGTSEAAAWKSAYTCAGQLANAVFDLRIALLCIEEMTEYARLSKDWAYSCDMANVYLELARIRNDIASLGWDQLMASP